MSEKEMKKLKTLKDMKQDFTSGLEPCQEGYSRAYCAYIYELRDAAREWIKELEKVDAWGGTMHELPENIPKDLDIYNQPNESDDSGAMIRWIKHFFNLDLEDE